MTYSLFLKLVLAIWLNLFGCYLFFNGFLPHSLESNLKKNFKGSIYNQTTPGVDRLVFVLIDALRADFVLDRPRNSIAMPFIQEKIELNKTFSFISTASLPTVTMPRIKAIVSGNIPSFHEVLDNSISNKYQGDSILKSFAEQNLSMIFFGDNTWLRLFPEIFKRSDGTNSFYVNDYTEVDNNVTRHLDSELKSTDWDVMILHYLGLDHIGHTVGPFSPLIKDKLLEMDQVIQKIYKELSKDTEKETLIVITGDHGMSNMGSHGGASNEEINTPFILLLTSSKGIPYHQAFIKQTDIAVTLSILFGINIPNQSIGKPIPILSHFFDETEVQQINQRVACQLKDIITYKSLHTTYNELLNDLCLGFHQNTEVIDHISDYLQQNSSKYSDFNMVIGTLLMFMSCIFTISSSHRHTNEQQDKHSSKLDFSNGITFFSLFWFGAFFISMTSSSLIEEEHYLYYYSFPSYILLIYILFKESFEPISVFILLGLSRLSRAWNQTGVKWSGLADIEDYLLKNPILTLMLILLASLLVIWVKRKFFNNRFYWIVFSILLCYKICSCDGLDLPFCSKNLQLYLARAIFIVVLLLMCSCKVQLKALWMIVTLLLLRAVNYPWFSAMVILDYIVCKHIIPFIVNKFGVTELFFVYLSLSRFLHFAQGNSNSFATVDIAAGMIGLTEYHPVFSVLISLAATYCAKFYWSFSILSCIWELNSSKMRHLSSIICVYQMAEIFFYSVIMFLMRYHLFIWSVFAPKYFYLIVQSMLNFFIVVPLFYFYK